MTVGHIQTEIALEQPTLLHYGSGSPIRGRVIVEFHMRHTSVSELFGPMEVFIVLSGRAKSKIIGDPWNQTTFNGGRTAQQFEVFLGRAPLIWTKYSIHQGPVRLSHQQPQSFSFAIRFPEKILALDADRFDPDPRFDINMEGPLPPSMSSTHTLSECFVDYRLSAEVRMPSIDVAIHNCGEKGDGTVVLYEQPRMPASLRGVRNIKPVREIFQVSNEGLLPEHQRPAGFREKTKAFFKSDAFPTFVFSVWIDGSADLQLGEPVRLELRVPPNMQQTTASDLPEIIIHYLTVTINSCTDMRTESGIFTYRETRHTETLVKLSGSTHDRRPFSKANEWTKEVTTEPLNGVLSTFSTFNISRTYTMTVEVLVEAATKKRKMEFSDIPIRVLPPAWQEASPSSMPAGPSAEEEPPSYPGPPTYDDKDNPRPVVW